MRRPLRWPFSLKSEFLLFRFGLFSTPADADHKYNYGPVSAKSISPDRQALHVRATRLNELPGNVDVCAVEVAGAVKML
jgi:hypothetical protein